MPGTTTLSVGKLEDKKPDTALRPPLPYLKEINEAKIPLINTLKHVMVSYVNRALSGYYPISFHGYCIVSNEPQKLTLPPRLFKKTYKVLTQATKVYYLGPLPQFSSFRVSTALINRVNTDLSDVSLTTKLFNNVKDKVTFAIFRKINTPYVYSPLTKNILKNLKGITFPTVEHFFREVVTQSFIFRKKPVDEKSIEYINLMAMNPRQFYWYLIQKNSKDNEVMEDIRLCEDLKKLSDYNVKRKQYGIIFPYTSQYQIAIDDKEAFEKNDVMKIHYPLINAAHLCELIHKQYCFKNYIEERLNMGESVENKNKTNIIPKNASNFNVFIFWVNTLLHNKNLFKN